MPSRHRSRQRALQILFQWDVRRGPVDETIAAYYKSFCETEGEPPRDPDAFVDELVKGVVANIDDIDSRIARHAEHWRIDRMPAVDRNVLRLAVWEMLGPKTPAPVAIDEALELVRKFSGEESVHFVNGVLDAAHRELKSEAGAGAG